MKQVQIIPVERLQEMVPSAFSDKKKRGLSKHYHMMPTSRVIDDLAKQDWFPIQANQVNARDERDGYQKHMIRFGHISEIEGRANLGVGDCYINMVLMNSHDGLCSFRFMLGLFRLVCSNGMVVSNGTFGAISVRHNQYTFNEVKKVVGSIMDKTPQLGTTVKEMQQIMLTPDQQMQFAMQGFKLRFGGDADGNLIRMEDLLRVHRTADQKDDVWSVFNRVQENVMKGGFTTMRQVDGRNVQRHARAVKAIAANTTINQGLWEYAEGLVKNAK
jgi:hypothetical protein